MMVRLSLPKRAKTGRKRGPMSMSTQLSGITHFGDITALTGGEVSCWSRSPAAVPAPPPGSIDFLKLPFALQDGISRPQKKKKVMKKKTKRKGRDFQMRHRSVTSALKISADFVIFHAFSCAAFKKHR